MHTLGKIRLLLAGFILGLTASIAAAEVVVVVSSGNPVVALSDTEIADIFLGRQRYFPDGSVAVPVDLDEASRTRTEFYDRYVGKSAAQLKMHWSKLIFTGRGLPPPKVKDVDELKQWLASDPGAISYLDSSQVDDTVRVLQSASAGQ